MRKTGCSGFAYVVNYADASSPATRCSTTGREVLVDSDSLELIDGTEVDFVQGGSTRPSVPEPERERRMRLRRELQRLTEGRRGFTLTS